MLKELDNCVLITQLLDERKEFLSSSIDEEIRSQFFHTGVENIRKKICLFSALIFLATPMYRGE